MSAELCGKPMPKARNGADRGFCILPLGHHWTRGSSNKHSNDSCSGCGVKLNADTAIPSIAKKGGGACRRCHRKYSSRYLRAHGVKPINTQIPGQYHRFEKCGCDGVLPERGKSNKFAVSNHHTQDLTYSHGCRVTGIIGKKSVHLKRGYRPFNITSHRLIRDMMEEPLCWRCRRPLVWEFGVGKTPHLHHNHETGDIYGFTHPRCNPKALEHEIDDLRKENTKLKKEFKNHITNRIAEMNTNGFWRPCDRGMFFTPPGQIAKVEVML